MTELTANSEGRAGAPEAAAGPAAVLWDMDGTLIDSEPLWLEAEDAMLASFGLGISDEDRARLIGSGLWDAAELFRGLGVPLSADEIVERWVADVLAGLERAGAAWRPGAVAALASLREAGIPCALVTMSVRSLAEWVAERLPAGTFAAIVAGDEVRHAKPHPEPYLLGAAVIGVPIESCVAFEDSPKGIASARTAGAVAIGVPNLLDLSAERAHGLLPSLEGVDAGALRKLYARLRRVSPGSGAGRSRAR